MDLEALVRDVARDGGEAWPALAGGLETAVARLARNQRIGRLRKDVDATREIVTSVLERLHANGFRAIQRWVEAQPQPPFEAWLRVIVRTAAIDVMRRHADYVRGNAETAPRWVSLISLATNDRAVNAASIEAKRREVETFLGAALTAARDHHGRAGSDGVLQLAIRWQVEPLHVRRLITKGEHYLPVLTRVLDGFSYPEVGQQLTMSRREVELIVGYIEDFLAARRFATTL